MDLEFSRVVSVDQVIKKNLPLSFSATPSECGALKTRFKIPNVENVRVDYTLTKSQQPKTYDLNGHLTAILTQECVSTLKPVIKHVDEKFYVILKNEKRPEIDTFDENEDIRDIDYIEYGEIDLGEIAAQYLAMNLDLYPRSHDADHHDVDGVSKPNNDAPQPLGKINPFAVLETLKDKS